MEFDTDNRYKSGKIYRLHRMDCEEIYIGSTCLDLCKRLYAHKLAYNHWKSGKGNFVTSFKLFDMSDDLNDVKIELIELHPCNSKMELLRKEGEYVRITQCLNKVIPGRTIQQWCADNKDKLREYIKMYTQMNKLELLEKKRAYRQVNRDHIREHAKKYRCENRNKLRERNKADYEKNRDKLCEYQKQYRQENFAKIKERKSEKVLCECGMSITRGNIQSHRKRGPHNKLMQEKQQTQSSN